MKLLTLDPSSTRTGYALTTGPTPAEILHAGYFAPSPAKAPPYERIAQMVRDLRELIAEERPRRVLVEMPDGKIHRGNRRSGGAGQSIYGASAGALWQCASQALEPQSGEEHDPPCSVETVGPNVWTRGRPKAARVAELARLCPAYAAQAKGDGGGDVGDAIMLAWWWWATENAL